MAYTRRFGNNSASGKFDINLALQNPDFQKKMLDSVGANYQTQEQPKANFLQRLLAMPMAVGSIPDVVYKAQEGKNPFTSYLENLGNGVKQLATGDKVLDTKTTSDLFKKNNILQGSDPLSKVGNFTASLAGDVLLDPTTYITFGAGGLAKDSAMAAGKTLMENLGEQGAKQLGKTGAEDLGKILAEQGAEAAAKHLSANGIENAGRLVDSVARDALKKTTLDFAGKRLNIPDNLSGIAKGVEAVINPVKVLGEYGGAIAKKVAPEAVQGVTDTFNQLFNGSKYAESKGLGNLYDKLQNFGRQLNGTSREVLAENNQLLDQISKLPEEVQNNFGHYVQGTMAVPAELTDIVDKTRNILSTQEKSLIDAGQLSDVGRKAGEFYFPQQAKGYTPQFIQDKFGDNASFILNDPAALKALKKSEGAYLPSNILDQILNGDKFAQGSSNQLSKGLGSAGMERTFPTMAAGEQAGVVYNKNAANVVGSSLINSNQALATDAFAKSLNSVTDDSGKQLFKTVQELGGNIPPGYKKFSIPGLENYVAPQDAHKMVSGYVNNFVGDEGTSNALKVYDKALKMFKGSVTAMSPGAVGYNIRNALGDISNMMVGGFGLRGNKLDLGAVGESLGMGKTVADFEKFMMANGKQAAVDKFGQEVSDVYSHAVRSGIIGSSAGQLSDEFGRATTNLDKYTKAQGIQGKIASGYGKVQDFMTKWPSYREDSMRIANLYDHFKQTGSWEEAGKMARMSSLDYSNLTPFEKNVMKRVVPFYCVPEDTQALTRNGWTYHNDLLIGDEILTYNLKKDYLEWNEVKEVAVFDYDQDIEIISGKNVNITFTPNHRWVVETPIQKIKKINKTYIYPRKIELLEAHKLKNQHWIKTHASYFGSESTLSVEDARLLGWLLTDGYFRWRKNYCEALIYQSPNKFLDEVKIVAGGKARKAHPDSGVIAVPVTKEKLNGVMNLLKRNKRDDDWIDVVLSLSRESLEAMYEAMYKGDGTTSIGRHQDFFACQLEGVAKTFEVLAFLLGKKVTRCSSGFTVSNHQRMRVKYYTTSLEHYSGKVWCPRTDNGTWIMKQAGNILITGNTFMKQNLDLQLKTFAQHPGRIMTQQKVLQNIGKTLSDSNMSQEDWDAMPDWMKSGMSVAMNKQGNKVDILTGFGDPTSAVNDFIGGSPLDTLKNITGAMSPAIKMPFEAVTGQSLFNNQQIADNTDATRYKDAPQFFKDAIGYKEIKGIDAQGREFTNYRADPQKLYLLQNLPGVAPYDTMYKRLGDLPAFNKEGDWKYLTNLLSGGRIYQKDIAREQNAKDRKQSEQLNKMLIDFGIAQPKSGVYLSPSMDKNAPDLAAYLKTLGYTHKAKTTAQTSKANAKKDTNRAYLNSLLGQ